MIVQYTKDAKGFDHGPWEFILINEKADTHSLTDSKATPLIYYFPDS